MDHTEADKRRMLAVIDMFREQDTVDELGLSAIWDAFAGLLFPGTGTVQTRARYFLFVPWVFQVAEAQRVPAARASARGPPSGGQAHRFAPGRRRRPSRDHRQPGGVQSPPDAFSDLLVGSRASRHTALPRQHRAGLPFVRRTAPRSEARDAR
jgi:hypothetical protein